MKTRLFYFFGAGVCVLLIFLLLSVDKDKDQNPQKGSNDQFQSPAQDSKANKIAGSRKGDEDNTAFTLFSKSNSTESKPVDAFQYITNILTQMGITTKTVEIDIKGGIVKWGADSKWGEYYGNPSSHSHPIQPSILQQYRVLQAQPIAIRGCYQTNWGLMRLYIKDDIVTGTFNYYGRSHVIGKLKDNILVGIWVRPAKNKRPMRIGPFQFAFTENWAAFKGVWKYKGQAPLNNPWAGSKIKCPPKGTKPIKTPVPGGPGVPVKANQQQVKPGQGAVTPNRPL